MTLQEVIDLSSDDEESMDDMHAEDGKSEATFPSSDKDIRKGYNIIDTVKQECTEQATDLVDSVKGNTFAMSKHVHNPIAASDQRVPLQTSYRDLRQPSAAVPQYSAQAGLCRQFWKAGDYELRSTVKTTIQSGMDHVRVHPKFLHSNATSHKWALGAIAELLDNAVDEIPNGATFVNVDKIACPRDESPALLVQDDGGGMDPDCIRQCMSLGYSRKNTNTTIGQYGNGFKTSTMRLGADVIVFSCCNHNSMSTQSIGLLSYTFLRETGHEDIVVPMVDYEILPGGGQKMLIRSTPEDWSQNLSILLQWSPYTSECDLLKQFEDIGPHGTKIIVYNLWLNDDGQMELDFDTDKEDIQLRGAPDDKQLNQQHISNRLRYSLRIYSSILYLHMPDNFKIILRGRVVEHHNIDQDLKFPEYILYKPQVGGNKEVSVITTIGFTKEAPLVNVHGFNVYHKNRLIMPFWRVFHENSSRGRGVVGVLEANFIEPAHDKQDFERTAVLLRLETRLKLMTIEYWNLHCSLIGYQPTNMKGNKSRNVPNSMTGPTSSHSAAASTTSHGVGTFANTSVQASSSTGIGNIPQSKMASTPSNFVPLSSGLQVEQRNTSSQHMNVGANNIDVDIKPTVLIPGVVNQSHHSNSVPANLTVDVKPVVSGMPSARGASPNTSISDEIPNAPASAPSTPPQQSSDLEDIANSSFRHRGDRMMDQINEDINNAHERDQGRTEDSASNLERDHFSLNGSQSAFPNGCPSIMSKKKRKISDVISSELSSKRQAIGTNNALANDNRLDIQCALDDVDIGSIPISEEPVTTENGTVNCEELEMLLEENRRLRVQCLEYDTTEKELQQKVTELENELQEVQSEYAKLMIESQSLIVKEET